LGLFFVPNSVLAQSIEDSIAAESKVVDSSAEIKSYEKEEDYKAVEKPPIEFIDVRLDTTTLIVRSSLNDSLGKVKKQAAYQYTPTNEKIKNESKSIDTSSNDFSFLSSSTFSFLFWFITIGFLVVIIVLYALDGNFKIFSGKGKNVQTALEEDIFNQNIFDLDYAKLIQQATDNADYNRAVRLGFLKILTILSTKKMIDYGVEKTNFDYQFQLIHTKYYQDFLLAANYFEYAWYSGIVINCNQYSKVLDGYKSLEQHIN
jgi:hypothetical protein